MENFNKKPTCSIKFDIFVNSDGKIVQPGEDIAGYKTMTFSGIKSNITKNEISNTKKSKALHNGVSAFMWLFTGSDEGNFDKNSIEKKCK